MNTEILNYKDYLTHPIFPIIREVSSQENAEVYVIGGFVRDLILHRDSSDIDCVIVGNGLDFARKICDKIEENGLKRPKLSEFKHFGTAMFRFENAEIEWVGARKESYDESSRKPAVENGTLQDDQNRRDFTINALAISLQDHNYGELLDPFDGLEDMENQIIRTPLDPDITFSDDPLRMLRAIRFATQLFFDIETETFEAIQRNAQRVHILSQERIFEEIHKIMLSAKPSYGFKLLDASGLLPLVFKELSDLKGTETINKKSHKDNFEHTLEVLDHIAYQGGDLWLRWAALLHDIAKPATKRYDPKAGFTFHGHETLGAKWIPHLFRKYQLPQNEKMKYVQKLVALHLRPIALVEDIVTDSAVRRLLFEAGDDIDDLMKLCRADITSKNREKVIRFQNNFSLVEQKLKEIEEKDRIRNFKLPINGNDIMEYYQIPPGEAIGIIKDRVKDAILEGEIPNDREAAWALVLEVGQQLNLTPKDEQPA